MEAAARGAAAEGGTVLGILPGADRGAANEFVTVAVPTGMGEMRNALIVRAADAVIAVGGEFGTLSEIALALKAGTPVVGIGTWELAKADGRAVDPDRAGGRPRARRSPPRSASPEPPARPGGRSLPFLTSRRTSRSSAGARRTGRSTSPPAGRPPCTSSLPDR